MSVIKLKCDDNITLAGKIHKGNLNYHNNLRNLSLNYRNNLNYI